MTTGGTPKKKEEEKYDDTIKDNVEYPISYSNKDLSHNWFDFNDSIVKPIPVNRIQIQFGGNSNENAYILLYRQKTLSKDTIFQKKELDGYLKKSIEAQNEGLEKIRTIYKEAEAELELIFIDPGLINLTTKNFVGPIKPGEKGNKIRLRFDSKLEEAYSLLKLQNFNNLVFVEIQTLANGLIQFKRIIDYSFAHKTFADLNIECWSIWVPFQKDNQSFIEKVKPFCGIESIPIRVNLRSAQSLNILIISYQNMTLEDFKKQVEIALQIPSNQQALLLMEGEAPKMLNSKKEDNFKEIKSLGIGDNSDVLINKVLLEEVAEGQEAESEQDIGSHKLSKEENLLGNGSENFMNILIERENEEGSVKYYADLDWTLFELIENLKKKFSIQTESEKRLRKMSGNSLFYEEDLFIRIRDLGFERGLVLRLESGKTPQLGTFNLSIRNQSRLKKEKSNDLNIFGLPNETIQELKNKICKELGLDPKVHRLYKTDWLGEPVEVLNKEDPYLREAAIKNGEVLVLRDKDTPLPKEVIKVNVYVTETGFPDDSNYIGVLQAREGQNLLELKNMILIMPYFSTKPISEDCLRLREVKKDLFFGKVYRGNAFSLKSIGIENNSSIVAQILNGPEDLNDKAILFSLKKRLVEYQTYTKNEEWVWDAPEVPTIDDLKKAIIEHKSLNVGVEGIAIAVYIPNEFQWLQFTREWIEDYWKANRAKKSKNKKRRMVNPPIQEVENLRKGPYFLEDGGVINYYLC